jgi:hypothetical protein
MLDIFKLFLGIVLLYAAYVVYLHFLKPTNNLIMLIDIMIIIPVVLGHGLRSILDGMGYKVRPTT